ncbi:hypothetical protein QFZ58_000840 [Streptomyces sp. B1I3]|nr:hypothetical protein [Streptomyces sp. B1I3]
MPGHAECAGLPRGLPDVRSHLGALRTRSPGPARCSVRSVGRPAARCGAVMASRTARATRGSWRSVPARPAPGPGASARRGTTGGGRPGCLHGAVGIGMRRWRRTAQPRVPLRRDGLRGELSADPVGLLVRGRPCDRPSRRRGRGPAAERGERRVARAVDPARRPVRGGRRSRSRRRGGPGSGRRDGPPRATRTRPGEGHQVVAALRRFSPVSTSGTVACETPASRATTAWGGGGGPVRPAGAGERPGPTRVPVSSTPAPSALRCA